MKKIFAATIVFLTLFSAMELCGQVRFDLRPSDAVQASFLSTAAAPEAGPEVVRETSLSAGMTKTSPLAVGDVLEFALFDDVTVTLTLHERTPSPLGGATFLASASGASGFKTAVVLQTADGLQVDIQDETSGLVYSIFSTSEKTTVKELDPSAVRETEHLPSIIPPDPPAEAFRSSAQILSAETPVEQPSTLVDILVAYDQSGAAWAEENSGGMQIFAELAVQKMNTALANSGLSSDFRYRLVGTVLVETTSTDLNDALYAASIAKADDGTSWSVIPAKRDEVGADIVTVLINSGSSSGAIGLAYALHSGYQDSMEWFAGYAFNACSVSAVSTGHTMTHEVGHNLGAGHSKEQTTQPGPQLYDYSAGCYFTGTDQVKYHTIMAYNFDGHGNFYTAAPVFSSPNVTWSGVPAGRADYADNVRTIKNTFAAASAWRDQVFPTTYDVFFSPESGAIFEDRIEVALTPGKAGLDIYYTLDGSEPTLTSQLYTGPIILTSMTTIKAAALFDGHLGPVCKATYLNSDLASALDAPEFTWETSSDFPWIFQTERSYDGVAAARSGQVPLEYGATSWLKTSVTGPATMSFRYRQYAATAGFTVTVGDETVLSPGEIHWDSNPAWAKVEVAIPDGTHEVRFAWTLGGSAYEGFNGVWLDTVSVVSEDPALGPRELYATVNGTKAFSALQWTDTTGDVTYTDTEIDWTRVKTAEVSVNSGTLTLDEVPPGSGTFDIASGARVKIPAFNRLGDWKVTGSGVLECNNCFPSNCSGLTAAAWTGTVELSGSVDLDSTETSLEALGHAGSKLLISGTVSGHLAREDVCTVPLELNGSLTIDDGYSNTSYTFAKLTGSGSFVNYRTKSGEITYTIIFDDISNFKGSLTINPKNTQTRFVVGNPDDAQNGAIVVSAGKAAYVASEKSWSAPGGVIVHGTLGGAGTVDGDVTFASGSALDATQGALTVTGSVTTAGTVTVTDIRAADAPVLTYAGAAPANPEKVFRSDGYLAYAMRAAGYTSIIFAAPPEVPVNTPEGELLHAFATVKRHYPGMPVTKIANPGVPAVIPGAGVELTDGVAAFTYDFGVSNLTVTAAGVVATATLGGDLTFADGVTLSLIDLNGKVIDAKQEKDGNAYTFTFPRSTEPGAFIFRVRATATE